MKLHTIIDVDDGPVRVKYHVRLTTEEREDLRQIETATRVAARRRRHAQILLAADAGIAGPALPDTAIAAALGVGVTTVARVRQRFVEEGLTAALTPRPRPNHHKRKVDGYAEAHLVALACQPPPDGAARWTLRLLASELVTLEDGIDISYETVRRVMKKKRAEAMAGERMVHSAGSEW
jgi:transposase